jgi:menaquinone-specific isochorismate synthase
MMKPAGLRLPAGHALCDVTAERMDIAFFRNPDGKAWMGEGPFTASAAPGSEGSFYINDFTLSDPQPWKTPRHLVEIKDEDNLKAWLADAEAPRISWTTPQNEGFKMVFRRIRRDVQAQRLRKMVPVLTEFGELESGAMIHLLHRVLDAPEGFWAYARVQGEKGFLGATPELLLHRQNAKLETMALAGTARPLGGEEFADDVKEIEEHEIVADFLDDTLRTVGAVQRGEREISHAGGLTHFRTSFQVELNGKRAADDAQVRLLHPTPAVGCLPRDEASMARLMEYRRQLGAPDFFGAPFGFRRDDEFHCVVAIRGVSWEGAKVALPCGCGIVGASSFDHEWRELRQKRDAVAKLLDV